MTRSASCAERVDFGRDGPGCPCRARAAARDRRRRGTSPTARSKGSTRTTSSSSTASLVLLRTYDERSVVYHRQGRIGTYAIFWNHEAMQAGSVHALSDADWIFPSYRESAIGLLRGMPAATVLSWWRGHPAGWWNPADYNVASICVPIATHVPHAAGLAWGKRLRGDAAMRDRLLRRRRDLRGRVPRGRELRCRDARAADPLLQQQPAGRSRRRSRRRRRPRRSPTRPSATASRACASTARDVLAVYEATREAVERARAGDGPTFIEAVSYRAAPARDRRRPEGVHRPRARRGGEAARVRRPLRRLPAPARRAGRRDGEEIRALGGASCMREGIAAAEAEPAADPSLLFEHAFVDPPASFASDLAELRRILGDG